MAAIATARPTRRPRARLPPSDRAAEWLAASGLEPVPAPSSISRHESISRHDDAVERLEGALAEQNRQRRRYEAGFETSREPNAFAQLCEANERVTTRARWLKWIDQRWNRGRSTAPSEETR
jgi:hypothetical protein